MLLPLLLLLTLLVAPTRCRRRRLAERLSADRSSSPGLTQPTAVQFASDGRVFVAEKSGLIKVFDSLTDTTPTIFADLRTTTHNFWDRGLLGLALHPNFPATPYVYVLYTLDPTTGRHAAAPGARPAAPRRLVPESAGRHHRRLRRRGPRLAPDRARATS